MSASGKSFLCVGAAHWDVICRATSPLEVRGDVPGSILRRPGGVALNVAAGLARAGCSTSLCSAVGSDLDGTQLIEWAKGQGIDCAPVVRAPDLETDLYVALEQPSGALFGAVARTTLLERKDTEIVTRASEAILTMNDGTVVLDANLSKTAIVTLARSSRDAERTLAVNPVSPVKAPRLRGLLENGLSPQIIGNRAEAEAIAERAFADAGEAAKALFEMGARACLITDGANTAALINRSGLACAEVQKFIRASVTGAGDALMAGYLACAEADPRTALRTALAAAAHHMETAT